MKLLFLLTSTLLTGAVALADDESNTGRLTTGETCSEKDYEIIRADVLPIGEDGTYGICATEECENGEKVYYIGADPERVCGCIPTGETVHINGITVEVCENIYDENISASVEAQ